LEEILQNLEDRKADWERVWKERDERLHHWLRLGDYQQQMSEVNKRYFFQFGDKLKKNCILIKIQCFNFIPVLLAYIRPCVYSAKI